MFLEDSESSGGLPSDVDDAMEIGERPKTPQFSSDDDDLDLDQDDGDLSGIDQIREGSSNNPTDVDPTQFQGNENDNVDSESEIIDVFDTCNLDGYIPSKFQYHPKHFLTLGPISVKNPGKEPWKYLGLTFSKLYGKNNTFSLQNDIRVLEGLQKSINMIVNIMKNPKAHQKKLREQQQQAKAAKTAKSTASKVGKVTKSYKAAKA